MTKMNEMDDHISRQAAIDALWRAMFRYEGETEEQFRESNELDIGDWLEHRVFVHKMSEIDRQTILNLPSAQTIDLMKHGRWIKDGEAYALYKCSVCNGFCPAVGYADCVPEEQMYKSFKFCPNCGAKMKRGEE